MAAGRGKTPTEVRAFAGGRVFTGSQALGVGLVDELGGLHDAVRLAKRSAGLPDDDEEAVSVVDFPPQVTRRVEAWGKERGGKGGGGETGGRGRGGG